MQYPVPKPLIVVVGPTAVGKTKIAIEIAKVFEGEIISADSRLFYRGMDIGTAKPSIEERNRVPHYLIDVANPDETWSLSLFQKNSRSCINNISEKKHLPILVGGTGQYIRAVIEDWCVPKQEPDFQLRNILEKWAVEIGVHDLHSKLAVIDPSAADEIDPRNVRRTIRALEVIFKSGVRFSYQRKKGVLRYDVKIIGLNLPRLELYQRIDNRIDKMLKKGLIEEVRLLLSKGYSPELPSMSAIGYREITLYLSGQISLDEAVMLMKRRTRQYVRRQANWFKRDDPTIHWFDLDNNSINEIIEFTLSKKGWMRSI